MAKMFPIRPAHPERNCWGCDEYCPSHALRCGNGSERTQHPIELFGDDWAEWIAGAPPGAVPETDSEPAVSSEANS